MRPMGLPPSQYRVLSRHCIVCGMGTAADGLHGQQCDFSSTFTKLRHESVEVLLNNTMRCVGPHVPTATGVDGGRAHRA